jgi:4,5-dihydroxyphthalate decarboxylase
MLSLTCAISDYDHVRDMETGRVRADGISLSFLSMPVEEIFFRGLRFQEFDVMESSMGRYSALVAAGNCPFVALPVFPSRAFRHSSIYVRGDGPVHVPADLKGKRIGVPEWAQTAGIYTRGMLGERYGVGLGDVTWVQAGINQAGREEEVPVVVPSGVTLERIGDRTLDAMLLDGDIDAMMSAHPPQSFERGDGRVRRLFQDFRGEELRYWRDTGVFPIMHTILVTRAVFEAYRWIAMNLLKAFTEAKAASLARAREATASRFPIPWAFEHADRVAAEFGDDYWPYGVAENTTTLATFLRYAFEQGITNRLLGIEDLFPPEVRATFRI